jgi:FKBP-type peptidyl-prolyl cis-trans isomerase FkpA
MIRKFIAFALILVTAAACKEKDKDIDYGPIDKKIIEDYIAAKGITNAQSTASGLYYIIQNPGDDTHPNLNSIITVKYQGYLTDGTLFDATATGATYTSPLYNLVAGWQEGLPLIGVGGKITLLCPSALGYGSQAKTKIPANSVILFNIDLIKIE